MLLGEKNPGYAEMHFRVNSIFLKRKISVCLENKYAIHENEKRILAKRNVWSFLYASEVL